MLNLNSIMLGSRNPKKLAEFYTEVFEKDADMVDGDWYGWQVGSSFFSFGPHSEVLEEAQEPARVMFNFETDEVQAEFDRMKEIGAKVVQEPYEVEGADGMTIATLEDPDGNYFQLASPWKGEVKSDN